MWPRLVSKITQFTNNINQNVSFMRRSFTYVGINAVRINYFRKFKNYNSNSYNRQYYNEGFITLLVICPNALVPSTSNNNHNNSNNNNSNNNNSENNSRILDRGFSNEYLLRFIMKRYEDCKKKENKAARNNSMSKYMAYHAVISGLHNVLIPETLPIYLPSQPRYHYKGWIFYESVLFLYGAYHSWFDGVGDPFQVGLSAVSGKPDDAVNCFVELNANTLSTNNTSIQELELMRYDIDEYWRKYFNEKYQSSKKKLQSKNDDIPKNKCIIYHGKGNNSNNVNKDLIPRCKPPQLLILPNKNYALSVANNNNNNIPLPPPLDIAPIVPIQPTTKNPIVLPLHYSVPRTRTKPRIPNHQKPTKSKKARNKKDLKPLIKKRKAKKSKSDNLPANLKKIYFQIEKDDSIDANDKKLLLKFVTYNLNNADAIKHSNFGNHISGILIEESEYNTKITSSNVKLLRAELFPNITAKTCYLHSGFALSEAIGGFQSIKDKTGLFSINTKDSWFFKISKAMFDEFDTFKIKADSKVKELFGHNTDNKDNDDTDNKDNDSDVHKDIDNDDTDNKDNDNTNNVKSKNRKRKYSNENDPYIHEPSNKKIKLHKNNNDMEENDNNMNDKNMNDENNNENDDNNDNANDILNLRRRKRSWLFDNMCAMSQADLDELKSGNQKSLTMLFDGCL